MEIPKYIQEKIHRAGKLSVESTKIQEEIIEWFFKQGIDFNDDSDILSDGSFSNDQFVDAMQTGDTVGFIDFMKNEVFKLK